MFQELRGTPVQSGVRCICGIICKSKLLKFERMLFRATRGNLLFNQTPADVHITDPTSAEVVSLFNMFWGANFLSLLTVVCLLLFTYVAKGKKSFTTIRCLFYFSSFLFLEHFVSR